MDRGIVRAGDLVVASVPLCSGKIPRGNPGVVVSVDDYDGVYVKWDGFSGMLRNYPGVGIWDKSGWSVNSHHIELADYDSPMTNIDVEFLFQSV